MAARARLCQLLVAESLPSGSSPAQERMARHRQGYYAGQVASLHLETLGVPVRWEPEPQRGTASGEWLTVAHVR